MATSTAPTQTTIYLSRRRQWRFIFIKQAWRAATYSVALLIAVSSLFPLLWTLSTSLKEGGQLFSIPPQLIPDPIFVQNYVAVWKGFGGVFPFQLWLRNSIFLTVVNIIGETFFAAVAGFGFARFRFRLRNIMFIIMLSNAIVPGFIKMLPQYMMFNSWHWTNTYLPLIIPNWFGGMFLTFLFRQYFVTIPRDLDQSAKIDGATNMDIFLRIILPLSRPLLATAMVMVYMYNWNNFFGPFIYLHQMPKYTLAVGMQYMRGTAYSGVQKEPLIAAYAILMAVPVIIVFFIFQRYFVQGIQLSASKE
ncbi:MAG: carbohydrate ABC transporter permease [Anaerolineae bacterium]|nr:carbohydrate ABC transporter permease [Anaerolineae bacterium]